MHDFRYGRNSQLCQTPCKPLGICYIIDNLTFFDSLHNHMKRCLGPSDLALFNIVLLPHKKNVVILKAQVSDVGVDGNPPGGRVKLAHKRA
jgi:hypothetical protein